MVPVSKMTPFIPPATVLTSKMSWPRAERSLRTGSGTADSTSEMLALRPYARRFDGFLKGHAVVDDVDDAWTTLGKMRTPPGVPSAMYGWPFFVMMAGELLLTIRLSMPRSLHGAGADRRGPVVLLRRMPVPGHGDFGAESLVDRLRDRYDVAVCVCGRDVCGGGRFG